MNIDENCNVVVSSCSQIRPFRKAQVVMQAMKDNRTLFAAKSDLCDEKKIPEMMRMAMVGFGISVQCPITSNFTICRNNEKILTFFEAPFSKVTNRR